MSIVKEKYGILNGEEVYEFTLDNGNGLSAEIITYGGIITRLVYEGVDVVCGRNSLEEYLDNPTYYGALIGRNSNRIANASFLLNGKAYTLNKNDGNNNLHGGNVGFDSRIWTAEPIDEAEPKLILTLESPDGEEGFPGNLSVKVTYTLTKDNALSIHYEGECDADTVLNMTNHSYFNLNGHNSGMVDSHKLWLDADFYTPNNSECVPTGEVLSVQDTPFDFTKDIIMAEHFGADHSQVKLFKGFDHNLILNGSGYRKAGVLTGDKTGIIMEMYTDCVGVQLYTCNDESNGRVCKDGAVYPYHGALCLETQSFPNNANCYHFPSSILKKGEKYDTTTCYRFGKQ